MIIGLIGPSIEDLQIISEALCENNEFQVVDGLELLRHFDEVHLNFAITSDSYKIYILKALEQELGTYIIQGNLLLNEAICRWLLTNNNKIVVANRGHLEDYPEQIDFPADYWKNPEVQRYELETKFHQVYDNLNKQKNSVEVLHKLNMTSEDFDENLFLLTEEIQGCEDSKISELNPAELVKIITRKENKTMTIEESIKNAMRELGVPVDTDDSVKATKTTNTQAVSTPKKTDDIVSSEPTQNLTKPDKPKHQENLTVTSPSEVGDSEPEDSIFVKMTDTTMALLIPADLKMKKQSIGGTEFNVATVRLPDIHCRKLQELFILEENSDGKANIEAPIERKPIIALKEEKNAVKTDNSDKSNKNDVVSSASFDNDVLQQLMTEKSDIDDEIKRYRELGDIEKVNELRKHRRALRAKINKLK